MATADGSLAERASCPRSVVRRLQWLLAGHLLLGLLPAAVRLLPAQMQLWPQHDLVQLTQLALLYPSLGQMMLLGLWAGLGGSRMSVRFIGTILGCTYLAIWPTIGPPWSAPGTWADWLRHYRQAFFFIGMVVGILAAVFLIIRRWFCQLRLLPADNGQPPPGRVQYSIQNVMLAMTLVAVVLGLAGNAGPSANSGWQALATAALILVTFCIDALFAVWATLGVGRIRWRILLVFLVAALLGLVLSVKSGHHREVWWLMPTWILTWLLPMVVVVASLLVIRSCGYRLVPKSAKVR
ncbi:MAG TPA: hypothetical protein VFI31_24905 [Pirellulales bacterium]|nr:hypothetical protein [Pirellulales bacterium]